MPEAFVLFRSASRIAPKWRPHILAQNCIWQSEQPSGRPHYAFASSSWASGSRADRCNSFNSRGSAERLLCCPV